MAICLLLALLSYPLLRRLPAVAAAAIVGILAFAAVFPPLLSFARLSPALDAIYAVSLSPGRGLWQMPLGFALLLLGTLLAIRRRDQ
jgi:NADH:ubiquinone oxidoreductase subunit 5 (subunit L)/multisubunit Na+/H+ antiporter MnhA subunit